MFKTLMTTTALTVALAVPSFAQELEADVETDMESTVNVAETELDVETDAESTVVADTDALIPEDLDGEEEMTVTADVLNGDAEAMEDTTMTAEADMFAEPELDQLSQFTGMTVDDIVGLNVLSADGEDVGEIDYVYTDGDEYKAVIGVGGFLGLGEYTVALPLGNFAMLDGELILDQTTEAELEAMPEIDESELEELDGDYVIS